jgi:hypothetical protein
MADRLILRRGLSQGVPPQTVNSPSSGPSAGASMSVPWSTSALGGPCLGTDAWINRSVRWVDASVDAVCGAAGIAGCWLWR